MNIWWIRRDLRLADNPALQSALEAGSGVLPVFILDDFLLAKQAPFRQAFLINGLNVLAEDLHRLGSGLVIRRGRPETEIRRLAAEGSASAVYAVEDYSPYAICRDAAAARQVDLRLVHGLTVHPPGAVKTAHGKPFTLFTPFARSWKSLPFSAYSLPAPQTLPPVPGLFSEPLHILPASPDFPPGEHEARRRLEHFLAGPIQAYRETRSRLDLPGTSSLSPYLRFGMLSPRQVLAAAYQRASQAENGPAQAGIEAWVNEMIWREFYQHIMFHFPLALDGIYSPAMQKIPWRHAPAELQAWQAGQTGYPVVDAAMRQLAASGWMHNRARMIMASFLVKDLLIDWREGEKWFMQLLMDGDPAANSGGWQWIAGTGPGAAPFFRIFNPVLQARKADPQGEYIRRWLPELSGVPDVFIHAPREMPASIQQACGVIVGRDYPLPVVDHAFARQRALEVWSNRPRD